tara:strand:+ start:3251 stop:4138 length:888 start_codon:yes stop_codon:yes gene_type:complete
MKLYFLINPISGKQKSKKIFQSINHTLKLKNINFDYSETEYSGHAIKIAKELDLNSYNGIIIIGGDGTFHEVISGLMSRTDNKKIPIGIVPGGSGNSFLYSEKDNDPNSIFNKILKFEKQKIDVLKVKTPDDLLYSINLVGWGLVTDIGKSAEKYRWLGTSRYTLVSLIEIIKNKSRNATLIIDNKEYKKTFTFIIACNTKYVGKGMYMAPSAVINDGLLDLIIVKGNLSRRLLFKTLPKLFKGTHINDPNIEYKQISKFSLLTKDKDLLNIDGELKGTTSIEVEVVNNAIEVFN